MNALTYKLDDLRRLYCDSISHDLVSVNSPLVSYGTMNTPAIQILIMRLIGLFESLATAFGSDIRTVSVRLR